MELPLLLVGGVIVTILTVGLLLWCRPKKVADHGGRGRPTMHQAGQAVQGHIRARRMNEDAKDLHDAISAQYGAASKDLLGNATVKGRDGPWRIFSLFDTPPAATKSYLFHGTSPLAVKSIKKNGFVLPGDVTADGELIENTGGACGAQNGVVPTYMSPSRVYATMYCVPVRGRDAIFLMAIGVKTNAEPRNKQVHTVSHVWSSRWPPMDPAHSMVEWLYFDPSSLKPVELHVLAIPFSKIPRALRINPDFDAFKLIGLVGMKCMALTETARWPDVQAMAKFYHQKMREFGYTEQTSSKKVQDWKNSSLEQVLSELLALPLSTTQVACVSMSTPAKMVLNGKSISLK